MLLLDKKKIEIETKNWYLMLKNNNISKKIKVNFFNKDIFFTLQFYLINICLLKINICENNQGITKKKIKNIDTDRVNKKKKSGKIDIKKIVKHRKSRQIRYKRSKYKKKITSKQSRQKQKYRLKKQKKRHKQNRYR